MKFNYNPTSAYEKFGVKVYAALKENFPQTYFVGGMVRDMLLGEKITDIDLATSAQPEQIIEALKARGTNLDIRFRQFGVVRAQAGRGAIEITTFRQDLPSPSRYPKVAFVKTSKSDSHRRDFTVNALYYDLKKKTVYDFHKGLSDLKKRRLKFIGGPEKRIAEDPLRIIRALRFQIQLNFRLEPKAARAIKKYFFLAKKLSRSKVEAEILKLPAEKMRKALRKIINSYPLDD